MDIASLQVLITTKGAEAAQRELDKLSGTAGKAEKSVGGLASSFKALGAVATVGAVVSLGKEAVKMADSYKLVEARLSLVTKGTLELANAQQSLFNISQNTFVTLPIGQVSQVFCSSHKSFNCLNVNSSNFFFIFHSPKRYRTANKIYLP